MTAPRMDLLESPPHFVRVLWVTVLAALALSIAVWWAKPTGSDDAPQAPRAAALQASARGTEEGMVEVPWSADASLLAIERLPLYGVAVQQIQVDWDKHWVRIDLTAHDLSGIQAAVAALSEGSQSSDGRWVLLEVLPPDGPRAPPGRRARIEWQGALPSGSDSRAMVR